MVLIFLKNSLLVLPALTTSRPIISPFSLSLFVLTTIGNTCLLPPMYLLPVLPNTGGEENVGEGWVHIPKLNYFLTKIKPPPLPSPNESLSSSQIPSMAALSSVDEFLCGILSNTSQAYWERERMRREQRVFQKNQNSYCCTQIFFSIIKMISFW